MERTIEVISRVKVTEEEWKQIGYLNMVEVDEHGEVNSQEILETEDHTPVEIVSNIKKLLKKIGISIG